MSGDRHLLIVGSNQRNQELLTQFITREGFNAICATCITDFDSKISDSKNISMALIDISGFDRTIWQYCEQLREKGIPLLVISPRESAAITQEGIAHGARSVLVKPLVVKELLVIIRSMVDESK